MERLPHEQDTIEINIDPKEMLKAYIERERDAWLPHYQRVQRSNGMNGEAVREADAAMKKIDPLLEELNALL